MKMTKRLVIWFKATMSKVFKVKSIDVLIHEQQQREKSLKEISDKIYELEATKKEVDRSILITRNNFTNIEVKAKSYVAEGNDEKAKVGFELMKELKLELVSLEAQEKTLEDVIAPLKERKKMVEKVVRDKKIEIEQLKAKDICTSITKDVISILETKDKDLLSSDNCEKDIRIESTKNELKLKELSEVVSKDDYLKDEDDFETWKNSLN